jgi:hypothetical protein
MDALLITPKQEASWRLDIDVVDGELVIVPGEEENVNRQSAAIAALFSINTIPGREELGTDWGKYLAGQSSLVECDNTVKNNMEEFADISSLTKAPIPIYTRDKSGGVSIQFMELPEIKNG